MSKRMRKHLILPSALLIALVACGTVSVSAETAEVIQPDGGRSEGGHRRGTGTGASSERLSAACHPGRTGGADGVLRTVA